MGIKGKHRRGKTYRKSSKRRHTRRRTYRGKRICMRGGNYETDVTEKTLQGFPMKAYNKVVTTVPGYGTMSVSAYLKLQEDLDRNGKDIYD